MALPYNHPAQESKEEHHPAQYKFEYGVKDDHTGDHKTQWEQREGKHVKGQYTLEDADGGHRLVEYESDAHGGINFHVSKIGGSGGGGGHGPAPPAAPVKKPANFKKAHYWEVTEGKQFFECFVSPNQPFSTTGAE